MCGPALVKLEIPTLVPDGPRAMHDSKSGVRPGLLPLVSSSRLTRHPSDTLDRVAILTFVGGISDRSLTGSVHTAVNGVQCYRAISSYRPAFDIRILLLAQEP